MIERAAPREAAPARLHGAVTGFPAESALLSTAAGSTAVTGVFSGYFRQRRVC